MKPISLIFRAASAVLLVALTTVSVSSVYASGGRSPSPRETPPPPQEQPDPGTPVPAPNSPGSAEADGGGPVIHKIFKILFDYRTMKDAIIATINGMFEDAVGEISTTGSPLYQMGSEISKIVFQTEKLKDLRYSSWVELRKVAFALLPLVAALTLWASMKEGLYSVTGYANTLEAVTEFVVSIALALASYWLMEQAIGLTESLTLAIAGAFQLDLTASVFSGVLVKTFTFGSMSPVMTMLFSIIALVFIVVFMVSVLLAFLAREVIMIITVALAPLLILLGSVRPLGWLRSLWSKAFFVFLLLLPVNVLLMGVSAKLHLSAVDLSSGPLSFTLQLIIIAGTLSILIALNTTLGKLVFGAAIEVAKKAGSTLMDLGSIAAGLAVGAGALGAGSAGALGGALGGSQTLSPAGGGGGGGGFGRSISGNLSGTTGITSTSKLTSTIGGVLSSSRSSAVRSFGGGLRAGTAVRDYQEANQLMRSSPPLDLANKEMPGYEQGLADVTEQFDTVQKSVGLGGKQEELEAATRFGADTAVANLRAVENAGGSARDYLHEAGYLHRGRKNIELAGREFIRAEAGSFVLGKHRSRYQSNEIMDRTPNTRELHYRDFAVGHRIVQAEQRKQNSPFREISPAKLEATARAVHARRLSGMSSNLDIMDSAANSRLEDWIDDSLGLIK